MIGNYDKEDVELFYQVLDDFKKIESSSTITCTYDDKYFGDLNLDGSLTLSGEGENIFKDLCVKSGQEIYLQDNLGREFKGKYKYGIKNIRKVKKGKRLIRKFDYDKCIYFEGEIVNE